MLSTSLKDIKDIPTLQHTKIRNRSLKITHRFHYITHGFHYITIGFHICTTHGFHIVTKVAYTTILLQYLHFYNFLNLNQMESQYLKLYDS